MRGLGDDERALSELIAFVLVFGVILTSVAVLSVTGFQAMDGYQQSEQDHNAERAMSALADNFNDVMRYDGIEKRYGELSLRGGSITTENGGTNITIELDEDADAGALEEEYGENPSVELGELRYESDSAVYVYEGGAVIREGDSSSIVRHNPLLTYNEDSNVAVISLVTITNDGRTIQSSSGQGLTIDVEERTTAVYDADDVEGVSVESAPVRQDSWDGLVEDVDSMGGDGVDRVHVTIVEAEIEY